MADEVEELRLPPFPNRLIELRDLYQAQAFLNSLRLPPWIATKHLKRWAEVVGMKLTAADLRAVEVFDSRVRP